MGSSNGKVRSCWRNPTGIGSGEVFTTGQVAAICKVAPRTVSKWFESGRLRGWKIPGSLDRRIPREALLEFLRANGMGQLADGLDGGRSAAHLAGLAPHLCADLAARAAAHGRYTTVYPSLLSLLSRLPDSDAGAVVLDAALGRSEVMEAVGLLWKHRLRLSALVVLSSEDDGNPAPWLEAGASATLVQPVDVAALAEILWPERR